MKLNLGCGDDFRGGWLNLDCRSLYPDSSDFVCLDVEELDAHIADGSVETMLLYNVVQFIRWRDLDAALVAIGRKLKPSGEIRIRVPDMGAAITAHGDGKLSDAALQNRLYGDQGFPEDVVGSFWNESLARRRLAMMGVEIEECNCCDGHIELRGRRS